MVSLYSLEINDADIPPSNSFQNQKSSIFCENCQSPLFENVLLQERIKVLEGKKLNL